MKNWEPAAVEPRTKELELVLEAVLFAASEPVPVKDLLAACSTVESGGPPRAELDAALERLAAHYLDRSIELVRSAGGYRFRVRPRFSAQVQAAQPERVAVSTQIMRALTEREWVHVVGHKEVPGRPGLYATTRTFLDDLGLGRLDELPPLDDLRELVDLPSETADDALVVASQSQEGGEEPARES
ncbi:MAG: SMC-Scp complex subunit ScpB [Thioalkalivibrio sp.]|nr:SMC-Scp complex subunit ScpB [Thioalkalivibrio sp.]